MSAAERLANYIGGAWQRADAEALPVVNPATAQTLAEVPLSPAAEVARAAEAALAAFPEWRRTPAGERIQPLFRLKALIEARRPVDASRLADADVTLGELIP